MVYTLPHHTPIIMPEGKYAITSFRGEIVDADNKSAPLSEVYDHHWIALDKYHRNKLCGPDYVFGIGAESRNSPVYFPEGYGYIVEDNDEWGANIHLLYTKDLAGDNAFKAAKECNECYYAPGKGSKCNVDQNGTFDCCGENCYGGSDSCKCPTKAGASTEPKVFYLRYTLSFTRDLASIKPMQLGVFTTPDCRAFYPVLRNDTHPENLASTEWSQPFDATILLALGHQHTGALNISLFVNDKLVCASYPSYGTEPGVAGNEKGYLVKMSQCVNQTNYPDGLKLTKGDKIRLDSWYYVGSDDKRIGYSDGTHLNVMGYMYTAFVQDTSNTRGNCCWGKDGVAPSSCASANDATCPVTMGTEPCHQSEKACTGPCGGRWCPANPEEWSLRAMAPEYQIKPMP
jgi:hypothetical protein